MERQYGRFKVTIRNQGTAAATIPDGSPFMAHHHDVGRWVGIKATGRILIPPGESYVRHQYADRSAAGTYSVTFKADPDNVVAEGNEANNDRITSYSIVAGGSPDLVIQSVATDAGTPTEVGFPLRIAVRNQGQGVAATPERQFVLKTIGTDHVNCVGLINQMPGTTVTCSCDAVLVRAGTQTWQIIVDPANTVGESDETNNVRPFTVAVAPLRPTVKPDLVIDGLALDPANPAASDNWRLRVTLRNQGTGFARIPGDYPYMAVFGRNGWVGVTYNSAVTLAPGETFTGSQYYREAPGPDTHMVTFRVDPGAIVQESNDSNSERAFNYTLR